MKESFMQNDENWASKKEDEGGMTAEVKKFESESSLLKKERKDQVKEIKKPEKAKAKNGRKMKVSKDKKKGKDIEVKENSQNFETKFKKGKKQS